MLVQWEPGFLMVQDKAWPHVARVCRQILDDDGCSLDENPTEHLWDIVPPQTGKEPTDALIQVWEEIPQDTMRRVIRHCQEWIQACQAIHTTESHNDCHDKIQASWISLWFKCFALLFLSDFESSRQRVYDVSLRWLLLPHFVFNKLVDHQLVLMCD